MDLYLAYNACLQYSELCVQYLHEVHRHPFTVEQKPNFDTLLCMLLVFVACEIYKM